MAQPKEGTLLVLTTSRQNREKLKAALKERFDLRFLESGAEALASLRKEMPDAIVMDNSIEDYMTFAFIDKVRNKAPTRSLPFVIVSRESTNTFVSQGIRSGVSHYIGIPFEPKVLNEKILVALKNGTVSMREKYFELPSNLDVQLTAFGRISYISAQGIHLEASISVKEGDILTITSPLSEALKKPQLEIVVQKVGGNCFYNYPTSVDASWVNPLEAAEIEKWRLQHADLNAPKKQKVVAVTSDTELQEKLTNQINQSHFSLRFCDSLSASLEEAPFIQPACIAFDARLWSAASAAELGKLRTMIAKLGIPWVIFGELETPFADDKISKPFQSPKTAEGIVLAFESNAPPLPIEPDRLYFSKTTEDSRLRIHFEGKAKTLGELGIELALGKELIPPCNLQVNLKIFSEQDLRNPYVRIWPPIRKLNEKESEGGKFSISAKSHFLGINDQQGQAIRQWLREEELKEKRKLLADVPPT